MLSISYPAYKSATISLPYEIRTKMNSTDLYILDKLMSMYRSQAKKSRSRAGYAYPGERWLGEITGRCRETISRSVTKMENMGLISITHRRRRNGYWQTNLYQIGAKLLEIIGYSAYIVRGLINRVTSKPHIVNNSHITLRSNSPKKDFSDNLISNPIRELLNKLTVKMGFDSQ